MQSMRSNRSMLSNARVHEGSGVGCRGEAAELVNHGPDPEFRERGHVTEMEQMAARVGSAKPFLVAEEDQGTS
jgi:hypothetical protein